MSDHENTAAIIGPTSSKGGPLYGQRSSIKSCYKTTVDVIIIWLINSCENLIIFWSSKDAINYFELGIARVHPISVRSNIIVLKLDIFHL